jgi:hypothetical protein
MNLFQIGLLFSLPVHTCLQIPPSVSTIILSGWTHHRDILIFTSSALKTWVLHVNTFYSWILLYISPMTAVNISILSVLYITHLLQLYKDTHVSLCTNLLICPYVLATIDAKALSLAADSCLFTISGAFALLRVCQM